MRTPSPPLPLSSADTKTTQQADYTFWASVSNLRITTVPWAVGLFCALVGALMLIVPHQFSAQMFNVIRPYLLPVGSMYLFVGIALLVAAAMPPPARWPILVTYTAASFAILFLAYMLWNARSWSGGFLYGTLGLGTLAAALISIARPHPAFGFKGDLFALILGLCAISNGLALLFVPSQFLSAIYDTVRPYILWFGGAFIASGGLLIVAQSSLLVRGWWRWVIHLFAGATFLVYMVAVAIPIRSITGVVFYGGFGVLIMALPWLGQRLARIDPQSLRLRLGLLFAAVAVVPLTMTIAFITNQQEDIALNEALISQQMLAAAQAHEMETYISLHMDAVVNQAAQISGQPASSAGQLQDFIANYSSLIACTTYNEAGAKLATSDTLSAVTTDATLMRQLRSALQPALELRISPTTRQPIVLIAAPIHSQNNTFTGVLSCDLEIDRLAQMVNELSGMSGRTLYVIDSTGHAILPGDQSHNTPLIDMSATPIVRAMMSDKHPSGALRIGETPNNRVAGYARATRIGWGVVVEYPVAQALASIQIARETTFGVLVFLGVGAMFVGMMLARFLTRPITTLIHAVDQFAHGRVDAPLPQQSVTEVTHLSDSFRDMRSQITEAAQEREEAIKLRDLFFSVAAHELKTPLTSLIGQAELLHRRIQRNEGLTERNQRSVSVIVAQSHRLNRMVSSLLDISRIQHGQLTLDCAPLDVGKLVRQVVGEIEPTLDRHTVTLEGDDAPMVVLGDELRLEQVLQNLISNAVKYSPEGGTVKVRIEQRDHTIVVAITDQGIGIPEAALAHVFQRFFRAPNVEGGKIAGMGIGLYVVQEILTMHGGSVAVESVAGQGSTFTVTLPLAEEHAPTLVIDMQ